MSTYDELVRALVKAEESANAEIEAAGKLLAALERAIRADIGGPDNAVWVGPLSVPEHSYMRSPGESVAYSSEIEINVEVRSDESDPETVQRRVVLSFPVLIYGSPVIGSPANKFTVRVGEGNSDPLVAAAGDEQSLAAIAIAIRQSCAAALGAGPRPRNAGRPLFEKQ